MFNLIALLIFLVGLWVLFTSSLVGGALLIIVAVLIAAVPLA